MMTLSEAKSEYYQTIRDAGDKLYHHYLENFKHTGMMDKDVIRISDGKKGRILLYKQPFNLDLDCPQFEFHPYTKSGNISTKQDGYILDINCTNKDGISTILNEYKLADEV